MRLWYELAVKLMRLITCFGLAGRQGEGIRGIQVLG